MAVFRTFPQYFAIFAAENIRLVGVIDTVLGFRKRYVRPIYVVLPVLIMAALVSCSPDVEYCDVIGWELNENGEPVLTHSHRAMVRYSFQWDAGQSDIPDEVGMVWIRPVKRQKAYRSLRTDVVTSDTTFVGGDYDFTAYTHLGDLSAFEGDDFIRDWTMETADMEVRYQTTTDLYDAKYHGAYAGIRDRNPYSSYLLGADTSSIFTASCHLSIPLQANLADTIRGTYYDCKFRMHPVTQAVTVVFDMDEVDVRIDSVKCIMSGAGRSVHLSSQVVNIDTTYKVPFCPESLVRSGTRLNARHTFHAPGLVRNIRSGAITGPGIMQVDVFAHYVDDEGRVHQPVLTAIINLYNILAATPSLVYNDKGEPRQSRREITLAIGNAMKVTRTRIENSLDGGLDTWIDDSDIHIDY